MKHLNAYFFVFTGNYRGAYSFISELFNCVFVVIGMFIRIFYCEKVSPLVSPLVSAYLFYCVFC